MQNFMVVLPILLLCQTEASRNGYYPYYRVAPVLYHGGSFCQATVANAAGDSRVAGNMPMLTPLAVGGTMNRNIKLVIFCALATALTDPRPAFASEGCNAFHGMATDSTKGPGGNRAAAGFSKGDTLVITRHDAPGMLKPSINLLEYGSPSGPSHAITEDTSDNFTYTVPTNTTDFIYLNFGSPNKEMVVTWSCTPTPQR